MVVLNLDRDPDAMIGSMFELCWSKDKHRREIIRFRWAGSYGLWQEDVRRVHPTQKPTGMLTKIINKYSVDDSIQKPTNVLTTIINKYSANNSIVLDLFGGSGSTLIACEKTKHICYMMEIDPYYVDVIIKRWEDFTGKKAVLIHNNKDTT